MSSARANGTAIIGVSLGAGGAEKQMVLLANHLAGEGRRPLVMTLVDDAHRLADLDPTVEYVCLGMEPGHYGLRSLAAAFKKARRALVAREASHMVSFTQPANRLGWLLRASGVPARHVLSERTSYLGGFASVQFRRCLYRNAEVVVANTQATRQECIRHGLISEDRILVIPNAVHVPSAPNPPEIGISPFRWVCVARLDPDKDIASLLAACGHLRASGHDFVLDVAGGGQLRDALVARAAALGVEAQVRFLGERRDIPAVLQSADGFVLSSVHEGLPNAILEAAGTGLPVVATDVGGTRETLAGESQRLLVQPGDPAALAERMALVMQMSHEERWAISQANYLHVRVTFSPDAVFRQWDLVLTGERSNS